MKIMKDDISAQTLDFDASSISDESVTTNKNFLILQQKLVDEYNLTLNTFNPIFEKRKFTDNNIIVRLIKEDFAHQYELLGVKSWVRAYDKIAIPRSTSKSGHQEYDYIENQLPYKPEGVIVGFDDSLKEKYSWLTPCLKIQLSDLKLMEYMYYPDRNNVDTNWSEEDILNGKFVFPKFEGYFKIKISMIESYSLQ